MTNNKFDEVIKSKFKETGFAPNSVADTILKITQKNRKTYKFKKIISGAVASLILIPSIVFASTHIFNNFGLKNNGYGDQSLSLAISNNYIQHNDSNEQIYTNDVNYKFTDVLLNDITMLISLDFNFVENIDDFSGMSFVNLKIYDENNTQIYIDSEDYNIWSKNIATSLDFITEKKENTHIKETLLLTSPKFNTIKNINISFDSLILYVVEDGIPKTKEIKNNKLIEIPLVDTFDDRSVIKYTSHEETKSNNNVSLNQVLLTNTGLGIRFNANDEFCGLNYEIRITDFNENELYSHTNVISNISATTEYFAWIDVNFSISQLDGFKLEIIDSESNKNVYNIML